MIATITTSTAIPCPRCGSRSDVLVTGTTTMASDIGLACGNCGTVKGTVTIAGSTADQTVTTEAYSAPQAPTFVYSPEPKRRAPDPPPRPPANRHERRRAAKLARRKW